jgi:hypothetical protein
MFDEQGMFVGNGVHVQVIDHSQELPPVEVFDAKAIEAISLSLQKYIVDLQAKMESIR